MPRRLLLILLVFLATGGNVAWAGEPPNQKDPCSRSGRDSCGTTGKGAYRNYRYGVRWFGDYRGAVADVDGGTFCIDLRYWYPSKAFDYEERPAAGLKNRDGGAVPVASLRKMNRALWRYGRSSSADEQAAVMLYVHSLMRDGAAGEVDPAALSSSSRSLYATVARDASLYAGPYRVKVSLPSKLVSGKPATATVEVVTASGRRVPNVDVDLKVTGSDDAPKSVSTASGVGKVKLTASDPDTGLSIDASAELPAALPTLYVPTKGQSARNAQRLVTPKTDTPSGSAKAAVRVQPALATEISAQVAAPGNAITDTIHVSGLGSRPATVQAALYGPFATRDAIKCDGTPVWSGTVEATGDGDYVTEPFTLAAPGYYTYRESIAESAVMEGVQTDCADAAETTIAQAVPAVTTTVSAAQTAPGAQITDALVVTGLGTLPATVNVELWGPFASPDAISCEGTPLWTGAVPVPGDGAYTTAPVTLPSAGYFVYHESIAASETVQAFTGACGEASETTLSKAAPAVTTVASAIAVRVGGEIFDKLTVTGLGKTPATATVDFGPYASRDDIDCAGTPYWKGDVALNGDGTFNSPKATVRRVGFYVFRESIAGSETVTATQADCADEAETSLGAPAILGGRGDSVAYVRARASDDEGPARVKLARLGIDAPVSAIGIDMKAGALGIPTDIKRVGWWRDSAVPGAKTGTVLLAGHVDSAKKGAGAFYALKSARSGDIVELDNRSYRVTGVKIVLKGALPTGIFTRGGSPKLVLVTCGGPFDAKAAHYRDNVIVTAVPA